MKIEYIKRKIKDYAIKKTAKYRCRRLISEKFTIISNNCWAGDVYRYFGLSYQTPTVGMYFFADEYIRFLNNLPYYLQQPLQKVEFGESKYKEELRKKGQHEKLLARLADVEVVLLHYSSWDEAKEKWDRRNKRVNFDNLIVKFSRQNLCTEEEKKKFLEMPYCRKLFFDNIPSTGQNVVYIPGFENEEYVKDDISSYRKYMDILKFINKGELH